MQIQVFKNSFFGQIRTMKGENGDIWFVAKDVAMALGYANPRNAVLAHVDDEDKTTALIQGAGSNYKSKVVLINESGLYALIFASKLPQAKAFKHWVTAEVLPQIRKTGGYLPVTADDTEKDLLKKLVSVYQGTLALRNKMLKEQEPKVRFAEAVMADEDGCTVGDLARTLYGEDVKTGRNRLFRWLREHGYLFLTSDNKNRPYQRWLEAGLFRLKETPYYDGFSRWLVYRQVYVTGKGQQVITEQILRELAA